MANLVDRVASDMREYLHRHNRKALLRLITCGAVDDGNSTLIGRFLYDSKATSRSTARLLLIATRPTVPLGALS